MCRLLIVEDETVTRKAMLECINWESLGIREVQEAVNGRQAMELAQVFRPNIVVTDIRMPEMDGLELARKLGEMDQDIHVIIATAYKDVDYLHSAIKLKALDYILKPVNANELRDAVKSAVKSYRDKHENRVLLEKLGSGVNNDISGIRSQFYDFLVSGRMKTESKASDAVNSKDSLMVASIKSFIDSNYGSEELSVKLIAEKLMYTSAYICMVFKSNTGLTVNEYITICRIQKAKKLLADVTMKLYDVSTAVGFNDENYFAKVFKKLEGITPMEYRKRGLCNAKS